LIVRHFIPGALFFRQNALRHKYVGVTYKNSQNGHKNTISIEITSQYCPSSAQYYSSADKIMEPPDHTTTTKSGQQTVPPLTVANSAGKGNTSEAPPPPFTHDIY
jgi:hypothetical protein